MLSTTVNINSHSFDFLDKKEACSYVMMLAISHHKYSPFETLKQNVCEACTLINEILLIKADEIPDDHKAIRTALRKKAKSILNHKEYLSSIYDRNKLLLVWCDLMMVMDGKALLPGFGFGSKKFKETVLGNPERISVTKTTW